jgi:hypothetical protein
MKRNISMIVGVFSLLFSLYSIAGTGWTDYVRIAELVPTARHYYELRLPVKENPSGCKRKTWFYQDYNTPGSDKMFRTLLESVKAGISVRVHVTGRCNINGYAEISSVSVTP